MSRYRDAKLQVTENLCDLKIIKSQHLSVFQDLNIFYFLTTDYIGANKRRNVYCGRRQCSKC